MTRINRMLLLFSALLMIGSAALAGGYCYHRTDVLSAGDVVHANFWEDSNDINMWVGDLVNYADMVTITLDDGSQYIGLNKSLEGYGVFHLGLSQMGSMYYDAIDEYGEMNNITIGYGYELEMMNIGVMLNRVSWAYGVEDGDVKETWHTFGFGVDYMWNEDVNVDAAFMYSKGSSEDLDDDTEDLDASEMGFGVRAFYPWQEGLTLVPVFLFDSYDDGEDYTESFLGLGLGFNWAINDGNDLMLGLSWQKYTEEYDPEGDDYDYKYTETMFPGLGVAVEHEFFDWLTARVGTSKSWVKDEDDEDNYLMTYPWRFELGAGIALGDWQVDLGLNTDWLYNIGYWVHGANDGGYLDDPIAGIQAKLFF